ncbi:nmrA-like family domain-containing protein 1 [Diadema antillarum]|uniref:nmrA-like family domain-containing protein 1 n=1 Tax=Diadema antillarum TaxID=105358 RepID=UPI003A844A67
MADLVRLITVFGATGGQGSALVRALIPEHKSFRVRGVTRNPKSEKAEELASKGVEIVQADYADVPSLERAMEGSYGVFALTDFWSVMDQATEAQQGRNLVDAAKKVGVKHFIYTGHNSSLELTGKPCVNVDAKKTIEDYMFQTLPAGTATSLHYSFYMENIFSFSKPVRTGEREFTWNVPMGDVPLAMIDTSASGYAVVAAFKDTKRYGGKVIGLAGDCKTMQEYCNVINEIIAPNVLKPTKMTPQEFGKLDFPAADIVGKMYEFFASGLLEFHISATKELDPKTKDFKSFVRVNKDKIRELLQ